MMELAQAGKTKIVALGMWLAGDPRRLMAIVTLVTTLAALLLLSAGLTHAGVLVGPSSDGGSGGG